MPPNPTETPISRYLATNLQALRQQKNLSQQTLSAMASVPRSTITHMESGAGNPSLGNLCKMATALGVSIEELLSRPRSECTLLRAADLPAEERASGARLLRMMPDKIRGIAIDRLELDYGGSMSGQPHLPGTKEYLLNLHGEITVAVAGSHYRVERGDIFAFPGDQKHGYRNTGAAAAAAISVVLPVTYPDTPSAQ
jgi:transcriptional regulator with XRE-family HTH domain